MFDGLVDGAEELEEFCLVSCGEQVVEVFFATGPVQNKGLAPEGSVFPVPVVLFFPPVEFFQVARSQVVVQTLRPAGQSGVVLLLNYFERLQVKLSGSFGVGERLRLL